MKISRSADGLTYFIESEGFSYSDFNKAYKVDLWRIAKHYELGPFVLGRFAIQRDFQITSTVGLFVRYQTVEISPEFYYTADVSFPWCMECRVSYVGKTSYWLDHATYCRETGKLLAKNSGQAVRVSRATRRPVDLPAEGVAKYSASVPKNPPQGFTFPKIIPCKEQSFTYTTKALPSDTDPNDHVNQSACFKYCHDGASLAALKGNCLSKFTRDLAYYNVKTFSVEYVGEMNAGDVIDVQCWEDDKNSCVLYFIIRVQERVTCRCKGEWYANPNGELVSTQGKLGIALSANL